MKRPIPRERTLIILMGWIATASLCFSTVHAKVYHLYYLGGQSNMDGYGRTKELPDGLRDPVKGVMIFHGNTSPDGHAVDGRGVWATLRPGHGVGFRSDAVANHYSDPWHYDTDGYIDLGRRFAEALLPLEGR